MSRFLPFVLLLLLNLSVKGQSSIEVTSTDGYVVNITLEAVGIQVNNPCPNGYNYDVIVDYDITFTGNNIPASGLWTLQGVVGCGSNSLSLPLLNQGGTGTTQTTGNATQPDCNVDATIADLLCDDIILTIQGPGIPTQQITLSAALPVNFTAFTATPKGKQVQLDWGTSNESRNDFFEVQRSHDAISWSTISRIDGSGSTTQTSTYRFIDVDTRAGDVYYRLRQVDFDGAAVFSHTVSLSLEQGSFGAFPNPTNGPLTIEGSGSITVRDLTGRTLLTTVGLSGNETTTLDLSSLRPGLYLVQTEAGVQKIMRN
jgi:hypothetical protein